MSWTLFYPLHNLEERVVYRREISRLRGSPDVEFVADLRRGFPLQEVVQEPAGEHTVVLVRFHDELMRTDDPGLLEIHERRRVRSAPPPTTSPPTSSPPTIEQRILSEYLQSAEGRHRLAVAMAQPLQRRLDYQSVARSAFMVEQLPEGALPIYNREAVGVPHTTSAFSSPIQQGLGAQIIAVMGDRARIANLHGFMSPASVGRYLEIRGSIHPGNNGVFQIVEFNSPTSVWIVNSHASVDYTTGCSWLEHPAPAFEVSDMFNPWYDVEAPADPQAPPDPQTTMDLLDIREENSVAPPAWARILDDSFLSED